MKARVHILSLLGLAILFSGAGCSTAPREGSLVYYDWGYLWCWRDGHGWRYLGRTHFKMGPDRVPRPMHPRRPGQRPPPGASDHQPRNPGGPAGPGTCYFFFDRSGTVLVSGDGSTFRPSGRLAENGHYLAGVPGVRATAAFLGTFDGRSNTFQVGSKPIGAFQTWVRDSFGPGGGYGRGAGYSRAYGGSWALGHGQSGARGGEGPRGGDRSGGPRGGGQSVGGSGGGGFSGGDRGGSQSSSSVSSSGDNRSH